MAQYQFDATQHASVASYDALPKGWYQATLVESELKQTKSGGQMIQYTAEILAPAFAKGRKTFLSFNTVNSNPEAVRIGLEHLASLSMAVATPQWQQTEHLHNKPFHLKLAIEKAEEGTDYDDRNKAKGYDSINVNRALAVQAPVGAGAAPMATPFPGTAPSPMVAALAAAAAADVAAAVAIPVQPAPAQKSPIEPLATSAQPWANAQQPWEQAAAPATATQPAPVQPAPAAVAANPAPVEPVKSPEQIAWEQHQAQLALAATQPAPAAPGAATQPWANAVATPTPQVANSAQSSAVPAEPPHPAQSAVPPWQQPAQ